MAAFSYRLESVASDKQDGGIRAPQISGVRDPKWLACHMINHIG